MEDVSSMNHRQVYQNMRGWLGYFIDIYHFAQCSPKNPYSYTKFRLINSVRQRTNANVFVEAGTFKGVMSARCASVFQQVYTVELDKNLASRAGKYLARKQNVYVVQGDAIQVIPVLLQSDQINNVLIFLDGHFSGGDTAKGDLVEPAVAAIKKITPYKNKIRAIIIDDFRNFGSEYDYPTKSELLQAIEQTFAKCRLSVFSDLVVVENLK